MLQDPISDMLIRIKNAGKAGLEMTVVPYSNTKFEIANILLKKNYIKGFSVKGKKASKRIEIEVLYKTDKSPRIADLERVSRPSRRVYTAAKDIRPVRQGVGMLVMSTPKGIMIGDDARKENVGGEMLFKIW